MDLMATLEAAKVSRFSRQSERMSEGLGALMQKWPTEGLLCVASNRPARAEDQSSSETGDSDRSGLAKMAVVR